MGDLPVFEEVISSQTEVLEAEQRLHKLEAELGANPTEAQLAAVGRARDAYEMLGGYSLESKGRSVLFGLGFTERDMTRSTTEFSGGWQMRIALAKLLIRNPEVLLLDEPTNHLDLESVKWLEGFLRGYAGTVIVVSHDRAFMDNMVDRVAEIDNGEVNLYKGNYSKYLVAREERLERIKAERAKSLEEIAHLQAFVDRFRYKATKAKQAQERERRIEKIKETLPVIPEEKKTVHFNFVQPPRTGDEVVRARGLVKRYGDHTVYDGIDFTMYRGDKVALVGPNGAGKSTLLRHVTGVYRQDSGSVLIEGNPVYENPAAKSRIASIPDELYYFLSASTRDMMRFYRGFYPRFDVKRYEALKDVFTTIPEKQPIRRLSKGMQKQSAFWLALCCRPDILVLDEPVDGLDPVMRRQVWSLLMGDVADHGTTVLVSSHNLRELEDVCDHVGILSRGKVLIERSLSALQENVVKMQVVFQEKELPQLPGDLQVLHVSQVGRIHTLIIRGNATEITNRLAAFAPILMEALPLTLEEIFIYELGGEDYAVRDIVL